MNEKLIVKNFGPIKDAELDLKKVTIFIGPQGSGKSTLAKLVASCKSSERPLLSPVNKSIGAKIIDYGIYSFTNDKSFFTYKSLLSSVGLKNKTYSVIFTDLGKIINEKVTDIYERVKITDQLGNNSTKSLNIVYLEYLKLLEDNKISDPIYIPTERFLLSTISSSLFGLMNNDINLPKTVTDFGNRYSEASTIESEEDIDFLNTDSHESSIKKTKHIEIFDLQFQRRDKQDFLIDLKNNYEVNLKDSASGMQSSIPLILVVRHEYSKGNKHFIIEEPELNLFPTTQNKLIGYLADKCTQNGNELLMTTHSPYVLTALNNLIFAFQVNKVLPERADEIALIIPREQWLNPDDVAAYYVGEDENGVIGGIHSIFNKKTGLIGENELDEVSDELGDEFNALMSIYRTRKRETVN